MRFVVTRTAAAQWLGSSNEPVYIVKFPQKGFLADGIFSIRVVLDRILPSHVVPIIVGPSRATHGSRGKRVETEEVEMDKRARLGSLVL
jgi:hypothetical protein